MTVFSEPISLFAPIYHKDVTIWKCMKQFFWLKQFYGNHSLPPLLKILLSLMLPRHVRQCSLLFSAIFHRLFNAFACRLYFCVLRSNTQETFLPVFPDENVFLSAATFHRCSSFYPHLTQRGGVKQSTVALWGLILQILRFNCLSIYISAIDLYFSCRHRTQREARQTELHQSE